MPPGLSAICLLVGDAEQTDRKPGRPRLRHERIRR
jgi:hypothetical protein